MDFFYLSFLLRIFTIHMAAGERRDYLFNSSLPFPPVSQTLKHLPGDYCWELTSIIWESLVSECKSLNTKLPSLKKSKWHHEILGDNIVIRNGKIAWKHGPYCWFFRLNLKYLGWPYRAYIKTAKNSKFCL